MKAQVVRMIVLGQVCLYIGILSAIMLKPQGLVANAGISYYGIYAQTVVPMAAGLLGSALFSWLAARRIDGQNLRLLRRGLTIFALLVVIIVVTPYSVSKFMDWLHTLADSTLFSLQLLLSIWLCVQLGYKFWPILLTLVELAAGVACALYLRPANGLLIQCQLLFQLTFGVLLTSSLVCLQANLA